MAVRTHRAGLAGVALLVTLALGACSLRGSGYQYVRDQPSGMYYKIPSGWRVYNHDTVMSFIKNQAEGAADPAKRVPFATTFDASRKPAIDRFFALDASSQVPSGTARVQALTQEEHDNISLADLRSVFVDVDEGAAAGQIEVLRYEEIQPPGGFRGERIVFNVDSDGEGVFTVDQSALLDKSTSRLYLFAIGCSARCYEKNRKVIDEVAASWTIKEK